MPLNNNLIGVVKIVNIKTSSSGPSPYIAESLKVSEKMKADAKFFMQGTPLTKILDIGGITQDFTVNSPILVGAVGVDPATIKDGRQLLNDLVAYQYGSTLAPPTSLPLLTGATINIGVEASSVSLNLKSDGDPNNSLNIYKITPGYNSAIGLNNAARIAKYFDFFVNLAGIRYYVESANIDIKAQTKDSNFLGVYGEGWTYQSVPYDGLNNGTWNPSTAQDLASYSGWQFPFVTVGGIELTVSGKAAVSIDPNNNAINYNYINQLETTRTNGSYYGGNTYVPGAGLINAANISLQNTGEFDYISPSFQIYQQVSGGSSSQVPVIPPVFNFNNAVVSMKNYNFNEDIMTVDFTVKAFVTN